MWVAGKGLVAWGKNDIESECHFSYYVSLVPRLLVGGESYVAQLVAQVRAIAFVPK